MRFMRYVDCASETHNERAFCEYMERELTELGIPFERQELDHQIVTDGWNILAKVPGKPDKKPFLFVFHLDTVVPGNNVESYIENGRIQSRGNSVLGADGKLAIAVVMEAVSRLLRAGERTGLWRCCLLSARSWGFLGQSMRIIPELTVKRQLLSIIM